MNFDRGFIKWQPFNSVVPNKSILSYIKEQDHQIKPTLFPEEIEAINELIIEAYYSHNLVELTIYEENKIKTYTSIITKIDIHNKIIYLSNKTIYFSQIVHIKNL